MTRFHRIIFGAILLGFALAYLFLIAMPGVLISGFSSIKVGMTKNDVFHKFGMPQFFGPALTDNWYFVHRGPKIIYAVDVAISRDNPATDGKTLFMSEVVSSVRGSKVSCYSLQEAVKQASQEFALNQR
jgi:hypothetical protein